MLSTWCRVKNGPLRDDGGVITSTGVSGFKALNLEIKGRGNSLELHLLICNQFQRGSWFPLPCVQTSSQTELENWITAIHSACATAVARQHHKEDTVKLLKTEIKKLEQKIDMDEKMKKMGEMQLSSVTDSKKKKTILDQVNSCLCEVSP